MAERVVDFGRITSERFVLQQHAREKRPFDTEVSTIGHATRRNEVSEHVLGLFRPPTAAKAVIADLDLLHEFQRSGVPVPAFMEAGPRAKLHYDPHTVRAAIVTTGGLAPGIHVVIHSIVKRHVRTYSLDRAHGKVIGVYDSFRGLCHLADSHVHLDPAATEEWLESGGSKLGNVRYHHGGKKGPKAIAHMVESITTNLKNNNIDILYVIGGDGSLGVAHQIALANPTRSIVGIPKTMDNDILWVWQSFGFNTAVEQATRVINTLSREAESTRRVCIIELFGAESGFVAANAALASGHVDLVLIPEVFNLLSPTQAQAHLERCIQHIAESVQGEPHSMHGVVVLAEGVATILEKKRVVIGGIEVKKSGFASQLAELMKARIIDAHGQRVEAFVNQPRHHIRAVPANAHDHIFCERLGALAVDNALAGYTDFMVSQWLSEFVLVPLHLVGGKQKSIPVHGMFWKQVVSSTGQPLSPAEVPASERRAPGAARGRPKNRPA